MIDSNVAQHTSCNHSVEATQKPKECGTQNVKGQAFSPAASKNPSHTACNVSEQQVAEMQAVEANDSSQQSGHAEKASNGNCPGSNIIANLLQELASMLQDVQIGSKR